MASEIKCEKKCPTSKESIEPICPTKKSFFSMICCTTALDPNILTMSPPSYPDLGKNAKDVFSKGYHFGLIKVDCKTKTGSGVEFNTSGTSNQESGMVFGSLETKYKVKEYGMTFSEKWNTDNTLGTEITVQNQFINGLKLGADCTFTPQTGNKTGRVKTAFQNENVNLNLDVDLDMAGPIISGSGVIGYQGWLAGYQAEFDTQRTELTKNNFALGFSTGDFILHTNVDANDDGHDYGGSIYQKISPQLETGIQLSWSSGSNDTKFGIGAKYNLDPDVSIRAKVNNASQVDGKNFNDGEHKIGLALELAA
ncbi:hypothetical protein FQA39_LY11383 [Lamprigera yunnana]|nr:hypothetical protein FQA39_LY11383 [Lamprigera yunnana]